MILVREVPGAMVKAVDKSCFQLPRLHSTVDPSSSQCGGGCHLGDSSSAQRMWCEHWPSAEYKQALPSQ